MHKCLFSNFSAQAGRNGKWLKKQFMFSRSLGSQSERGRSSGWCFSTDIREGGHGLSYSSSSKNSWYGGRRTKYKDWEEKREKDQISFKNLDVCDLKCLLTITCYCSSLLQDRIKTALVFQLCISGLWHDRNSSMCSRKLCISGFIIMAWGALRRSLSCSLPAVPAVSYHKPNSI